MRFAFVFVFPNEHKAFIKDSWNHEDTRRHQHGTSILKLYEISDFTSKKISRIKNPKI